MSINLYAHQSYIHRRGRPKHTDELAGHEFVVSPAASLRAPFSVWLGEQITPDQVSLATENHQLREEAIFAGIGIGFMSSFEVKGRHDMVRNFPPQDEWSVPLWLVTHVDLHRTAKVQAMLDQLKRLRPQPD